MHVGCNVLATKHNNLAVHNLARARYICRSRYMTLAQPWPLASHSSVNCFRACLKLNSTTRTPPDKVRGLCLRPGSPTKSAHIVGDELNSTIRTRHGPDRTRTDFFCGETPLGPCGSGRVRVVEFSSYPTTCADFVRVRSVSGPCRVRVRVVEFSY